MTIGGHMKRQSERVPPIKLEAGKSPHIPVLLSEVIEALSPRDGGVYVDATFGAGGYSRAVLEAADCAVIAIDCDPQAQAHAASLCSEFGDRVQLRDGRFGDMDAYIREAGYESVDGIMLDLGVSSMQLDEAVRGFSFMQDGPLDMRMSGSGQSAEDLLNESGADLLANIIAVYGEERRAKAIARAIEKRRAEMRLTRTGELVEIICAVLGQPRIGRKHPATRTFQALRIYLNDELGELMDGLLAAEQLLGANGRLVVVTFHSLEDRMVKRFMAARTGRAGRPSRHRPEVVEQAPAFTAPMRKPMVAGEAELDANPRARSAKLRVVERTQARPLDGGDNLLPARAPRLERQRRRA